MKIIKKGLLFLLVLFVLAQFFRPNKNEGNVTSVDAFIAETKPPEAVRIILKESCFNCHSAKTNYLWYHTITPINYWMEKHINEGKKHFNVSNWTGNSAKRKDEKFAELIKRVENKTMPLQVYTFGYGQAKLTDKQIKAVANWAQFVRIKYGLEPKAE